MRTLLRLPKTDLPTAQASLTLHWIGMTEYQPALLRCLVLAFVQKVIEELVGINGLIPDRF